MDQSLDGGAHGGAHVPGFLDVDKEGEWELGALFVQIVPLARRAIGGTDAAARSWLNGQNRGLACNVLIDLIRSTEGLVRVLQYLDSARGRI